MILNENKAFLAYRCPRCGSGVIGLCGSFALSGGRLFKLKCPCGESSMSITEASDRKLRVTLPCLLCNTDHTYTVSPSLFYGRELFLLNCAYSGLDICFIGTEEKVRAALTQNENTLLELFEESELGSLSRMSGEDRSLPDSEVLDIIRFLLCELEADGKIDCPCHNGEYELDVTAEGVRVFCRNCGGSYLFPVDSVRAAQEFLTCDSLTLGDPEEERS